jgi:TonB-linked SusC/RagA family outer membrane protein
MINYEFSEWGIVKPSGKHKQLWRIMKITSSLLLWVCLHVSAASVSQTVTLKADRQPLTKVLATVKKQTGYRIMYNDRFVSPTMLVSIDVTSQPFELVLDQLLAPNRLTYHIEGKTIAISQMEPRQPENTQQLDHQQQRVVSGNVTDEKGNPLEGVTVHLKESGAGTTTNAKGYYQIRISGNEQALVYTIMGFKPVEMPVGSKSVINVSLQTEVNDLGEVVVVGYGTQHRGNIATSISTVKNDALLDRAAPSIGEALQGQVPGLMITSKGQPGQAPAINLRGATSLNGEGSPLVLIDGVPGDFNYLNAEDIASVNILKDAASAAIYGSRAANGVILIVTKRGKLGKPMFKYNGSVGVNTPTALPKPLGSADFARHYNIAQANQGGAPIYTDEMIAKYKDGSDPYNFPSTNWFDLALENSKVTRHAIEVSGGTEAVKYLVSGGFNNQTGIIPENTQNVFNARSSTDIAVSDKFNFSFDMRYQLRKLDQLSDAFDVFKSVYGSYPTSVPYAQNGEYAYNPVFHTNPLVRIFEGPKQYTDIHDLSGIFKFDYKIVSGLKFTGLANVNYVKTDVHGHNPLMRFKYLFDDGYFQSGETSSSERRESKAYYNLQGLLNYQKTFRKHGIDVLFGYQQENQEDEWISASRAGYPTDILWVLDAGPKEKWQNGGNTEHWALASFLGRVNYDFNKKYLLTLSFRSDASSRFAKENRWNTFPSLAAAWRLSSEQFMKNTRNWLDDLKIRGSWGENGSSTGVGLYPSYTTIKMSQAVVDYTWLQTAALNRIGNTDLSWERTKMLDLGIDATLFNNRLGITADYYIKNTIDILIGLPVPLEFGFGDPNMNIGKMQNRGWELLVNWNDAIGDLHYGITGTFSDNRNKVTDLAGTGPWKDGYTDEGLPFTSYYGYESLGLFQTEGNVANAPFQTSLTHAGDIRYKDQLTVDTNGDGVPDAGDGKIDANDRVVLGDRFAHYLFGLGLDAKYKGFDFRLFFQGIGKKDVIITDQAVRPFSDSPIFEHQTDYWTPENPDAKYPRLLLSNAQNYSTSDFWKINGGYFRCKNIQLGYSLPKKLISSLGLAQLRVYVTANNLFTLSGYVPGYDPEISAAFSYPLAKTFAAGLNIQF